MATGMPKSLGVMKDVHRTPAYIESNEFIEFQAQKSTKGICDSLCASCDGFED
jgi:hypothetical protein